MHRVAFKLETLLQGVVSGVSHRFYQAAHTPLRRGLAAAAMSGEFDVMQIDYWYLGLDWIARCEIPSVCYVHDLTYQRLARQSEHLRNTSRSGAARALVERFAFQRGLRQSELDTLSGFDALAAISPEEAQELRHTLPGHRVEILPAGVVVSDSVLAPYTPPEEAHSVVFVGALGSVPNADGVHWFAKRTWPLVKRRYGDARFYVVGHHPGPRIRGLDGVDGVSVVGGVSDVMPWYRRCSAVVSPLLWGSGMKGKVLEAMAFGRPLVATPISMEGIAAESGVHYLAAETPVDMASAICALLSSRDEQTRLATNARRLVAERYERAACMQRFMTFVEGLAS